MDSDDPSSASCSTATSITADSSKDPARSYLYSSSPPFNHELRCHHCRNVKSEQALKRCAACRVVMYCSKECQKKAWPEHKYVRFPQYTAAMQPR
ncbi:hypothetical protein OH77DRAFT_1413503 [Trametes cingulata]|nr:hypothetical protein OH77DRAFT_1413503 [Trametes cingulata]